MLLAEDGYRYALAFQSTVRHYDTISTTQASNGTCYSLTTSILSITTVVLCDNMSLYTSKSHLHLNIRTPRFINCQESKLSKSLHLLADLWFTVKLGNLKWWKSPAPLTNRVAGTTSVVVINYMSVWPSIQASYLSLAGHGIASIINYGHLCVQWQWPVALMSLTSACAT